MLGLTKSGFSLNLLEDHDTHLPPVTSGLSQLEYLLNYSTRDLNLNLCHIRRFIVSGTKWSRDTSEVSLSRAVWSRTPADISTVAAESSLTAGQLTLWCVDSRLIGNGTFSFSSASLPGRCVCVFSWSFRLALTIAALSYFLYKRIIKGTV